MVNQDSENQTPEQALTTLARDLWAQGLHDPKLWAEIEEQKNALPWLQPLDLAFVAVLILAVFGAWLLINFLAAIPVAVIALLYTSKKRAVMRELKRRLDFLTSEPGEVFPPIAVSKIIAEALRRSPELSAYLSAVNAGGRHRISAFELSKLVRFLSALDRLPN